MSGSSFVSEESSKGRERGDDIRYPKKNDRFVTNKPITASSALPRAKFKDFVPRKPNLVFNQNAYTNYVSSFEYMRIP